MINRSIRTSTSRAIQLKSRLLTHSAHVRQNHVFCQHQCTCTINHVSPLSVHVHPFVLFCRITCWLPAISCCFQPFMSRPGELVASSKIVKIVQNRQKMLKSSKIVKIVKNRSKSSKSSKMGALCVHSVCALCALCVHYVCTMYARCMHDVRSTSS